MGRLRSVRWARRNCISNTAYPGQLYQPYGYAQADNIENQDPRYVNAAAGDFTLAPGSPCAGKGPAPADVSVVYRLRHPLIGAYLYTVYPSERDSAQLRYGYVFEGNCCNWLVGNYPDGRLPLFRLFSSNAGEYFFTIYPQERDNAVGQFGYIYEGVAAYCHPASAPSAPTPWYRLRLGNKHFYTIYAGERDSVVRLFGYSYEGISCFLPAP